MNDLFLTMWPRKYGKKQILKDIESLMECRHQAQQIKWLIRNRTRQGITEDPDRNISRIEEAADRIIEITGN